MSSDGEDAVFGDDDLSVDEQWSEPAGTLWEAQAALMHAWTHTGVGSWR